MNANVTSVCKGKGRDSLNLNSYRGIGVSTVLSELFETIVLSRMLPELENRGFSIATQTAEQREVSCEDATSSVFETVSHSMRNEETML